MNKETVLKNFKRASFIVGGAVAVAAVVVPLEFLPPAPYGTISSKNDEQPCTEYRYVLTQVVGRDVALVKQIVTGKPHFQQDQPGSMCYDSNNKRSYTRAKHPKFVTQKFNFGVRPAA